MASEGKEPGRGSKGEKPRYESPVILPLGGMARGVGATCSLGGNPNAGMGVCALGSSAKGQCRTGGGGRPV